MSVEVVRCTCGRVLSGSQTRICDPPVRAPANRRGATPTIVTVTPFTFIARPITSGERSKCLSHSTWLITATSGGAGSASFASIGRPGAECRAKTQHLEIVAGDVGRGAALRVRLARADVEDDIGRRPCGDVAEQRPLRRVLPILGIRELAADRTTRLGAIDAADPDQRLLPRDARHRTADERPDEQEQRGAEADAEREDPDHRRGGNRRAREVAGREAQVLNRVFDHVHAAHVPARFLRLLDAAERAQAPPGAPARAARRGRHPPPRAGRCGRGSRRRAPARRERGGTPTAVEAARVDSRRRSRIATTPSTLTTREMAPESRSQSAISRSSARRPARESV